MVLEKETAQQLPIFKILSCSGVQVRNKLPTHGDNVQGCVSRGKTRDGDWVTACTHYKDLQPMWNMQWVAKTCMFWNQLCHTSASVSAKTKQSQTRMPNTTSKNNVSRKNATGPRGWRRLRLPDKRSCAG